MPILKFSIESELKYSGCGIMKTEEPWRHLPRVFDLWVLALCTAGTMYMTIEQENYTIRPGDMFILPARKLHYGSKNSDGAISYYWMHFEAPSLEEILSREKKEPKHPEQESSYLMYHTPLLDMNTPSMLFQQLYINNYAQHYTPNLQNSLFKALLYEVSNQTLYRHAHKFDQRFMQLLDYIRSHFLGELSIDGLSEQFGYNKSYLCRLFKAKVGKTIKSYQNELRICYACQILSETCTPIKNISSQVGFESEKYFMRMFKQYMNTTPTAYRNAHRIATLEKFS